MKKKILSEGLLIFLIMIIGIFSSIPTVNAESKASLSASEGIDSQKEKTVTVTLNIPSGAIGAQADITIKYSDNTTDSKKIAFVTGLGGNSVTFSAKGKTGIATITASNIRISDANSESIETNGSTSTSVTLTKPDNSNDNNNNNNNSSSSDNNNSNNGNNGNNSTTSTEPTFTEVNETVYTNDRVNLRKSYSTSSAKIATLDKNAKLTRTGVSSNGWSRVTYNGQTGYIYTQYLTKDETTTEKPKEVKITDVNETMYANQNCNLRQSWATSSDKVGYLTKGQEIIRTGVTDNGWSRIKYNDKDVFVLSSLITKEKPEENEEEPDEPETEDTENEAIEEEKTELEILQEEIGVLPEVGNNISTTIYIITTIVSSLGVLIGLYYINKKDVK